jgi:hypothetical protein
MPKQQSDEATIDLTLTLEQARHIAPALRHWATRVCERDFAASSDPFGALHDAARTYASLMMVSQKLFGFCRLNDVEPLYSDGHRAR